MKTKLLSLLAFIIALTSYSQTTFTLDGLDYEVISTTPNEVKITGGTPATTDLVIPASVTDNSRTYSVTVIGVSAFGIDEDDFSRNTFATITSVNIPNTVRIIEDFAFASNQLTGELIIPDSVITLGRFIFLENQITDVTLSENLTEITEQAFAFNDIIAITLPDGITAIGESAFHGNALTELVVPEGVTTIGEDAFRLNDLTIVTIPSTVTAIGDAAFELNAIEQFTSLATSAPTIIPEGFPATFDNDVSNATLNIPEGTLRSYLNEGWSVFGTIIAGSSAPFQSAFTVDGINYLVLTIQPNEVTVIGQEGTLTSITIPETVSDAERIYDVVAVKEFAFDGGNLTSITFPNTLLEIGRAAFRGNQITSVTLPDDLTVLSREAFRNNQINSLTINTNLATIGDSSFQNNQLTSIDIQSNITTIGVSAFNGNQIASLVIPNSVTQMGSSAFGDNNISTVTLSDNLTTISKFVFRNNNITSVTIPNGVTLIEDNAFDNNQLEALVIPDNVTSMGIRVFRNNNIASLTIGSGITTIDTDVFANNQLTEVTIPSTITAIRFRSFNNNPLTTVISEANTPPSIIAAPNDSFGNRQNIDLTVPDGTEDAYEAATWTGFKSVNGIVEINIGTEFEVNGLSYRVTALAPNEVEVIGGTSIPTNLVLPATVPFQDEDFTLVSVENQAFINKQLTNLTLPSTVTSLGARAFEGNPLTTVIVEATTPPNITTGNNDSFSNRQNIDLTVPDGTEDAYEAATWTGFKSVNGIRDFEIGDTFTDNNLEYRVTSLTPNEVEIIGGTPATTELVIQETVTNGGLNFTVTSVGDSAFKDKLLTAVTFPTTIITIADQAFRNNQFTSLTLPEGVTTIGFLSFQGSPITSLNLPTSLISIGELAFVGAPLTSLTLPEGLVTIGDNAFRDNQLTNLTFPSTVTSVGARAFEGNPLTTLNSEAITPPSIITGSTSDSFFQLRPNIDLYIPVGTEQAYVDATWTGFKSTTEANKALAIKVFLQGAFINPNAGEENLMRDDLRLLGLVPFVSPYEDAETILDTLFVEETEGEDAIVDWVFIELRDALDSSIVIEGKSALLQRDGDVVGVDAVSPLQFASTPDDYFIAVKHRNHLGVILEQVKRLSPVATVLDFTKADSPISLGNNAQTDIGLPANTIGLWAGDANADSTVRFSGANAEPTDIRDGVLNNLGNIFGSLFFAPQGYFNGDINMDGELRFSGANSEPLFIKDNILGNPGNAFNSLFFSITTQIPQN